MSSFIEQLTDVLGKSSNADNAFHMSKYMRGKFPFYGIKTTERRHILKQAIANNKEELAANIREITFELYSFPQRELHLCATELFEKFLRKKYLPEDIVLIEKLITTNSWWDTVDFISKQILGQYLLQYPEAVNDTISKFSKADNIWLNRSTIIFQLGYKQKTDEKLLFQQCEIHKNSDEFFIQKAIGWSLREYAKISPQSVLNFVNSTSLKPLSHREAIRNLI